MKSFIKQLTQKLKKSQKSGKLKRYRVTVNQSQNIESGATNIDFRGGYFPTTINESINGSYLFEWPDGKLSKGYIGRENLQNFEDFLTESKATGFDDPFGDNFPGPAKDPKIKVGFSAVEKLYKDPEEYLQNWIQTLSGWQDELNPNGSRYIKFSLDLDNRIVFSSEGLELSEKNTSTSFISGYDSKIYFKDTAIKALQPEDVLEKRKREEKLFRILNKKVSPKQKAGEWPVIFHPDIFQDLLFSVFLTNFRGSLVVNGQSKFPLEDFKSNKQVFRKDVSITTDPTLNGKLDSYNFTREGLLSKKTTFIKDGRLITPILNAKYARKAEMEPTAKINRYMDATRIESKNSHDFDSFVAKQENTLLIYDALGMHGQEPSTGNYSLPCPYAILIENGEMVGNAPCVVTGNVFSDFNNPEALFLNHPTEHPPAMATTANVVFT